MRTLFLTGWLLALVAAAGWHFGPGQDYLRLDDAGRLMADAERHAADQDWAAAVADYDAALKLLPAERVAEVRRIRLEKAKAQMLSQQLPEAYADLNSLVDELKVDAGVDPKLVADARSTQASAQYYLTWLLRLEGEAREVWEPEIEGARQTYRMLAEQADAAGDAAAARTHREDLESAIRLARMDLNDLQGLALPCQCCGCKSGKCKNPGKKPGTKGQPPPKDARSAGSGPPPDSGGH